MIETTIAATPSTESPLDRPSDMTQAEFDTYKLHRRFDRLGRLIGDESMKKLMGAHVMIIGLGGVGSWCAEMLARSGVGKLTLIDFDEICVTNFNRQLHALQGMVGKQKAEAVAERLRKINPQAEFVPVMKFFNQDSKDEIFETYPDFVVDAIDSITPKCMLLAFCHEKGIPVISSTGSAGRLDPTRIQIADLGETEIDPLAKAVRRILRQQYGFSDKGPFGIQAVYSMEPPTEPEELRYDQGKGFKCVCPQGNNTFFNCDNRNVIMGSAGFVTSAFGMACASYVVKEIIKDVAPRI